MYSFCICLFFIPVYQFIIIHSFFFYVCFSCNTENGLLNDNSDLLATSHGNTALSTTFSSSSSSSTLQTPITAVAPTPTKTGHHPQSDEAPQYPDSTTGHNEYQGVGVIEVDVTTQIPGQLPKLKLKFDGRKFVPLNIADSSSNRIAFEKAFIKLKRNNKDLNAKNESRTGNKTELNESNVKSIISFKKMKSQQHHSSAAPPPSVPIVAAPLKRPRGRPPKEKDHKKNEITRPKGRPKKQQQQQQPQYQSHQQPSATPPPGQSQKCLQEILRKAKELQRQAEAVLHCDYTTNIKGELSWTSSVAAVPPPTTRDLFTYNNQTERRSENDKGKQKEQLRNNNYGKGDGVEDIERGKIYFFNWSFFFFFSWGFTFFYSCVPILISLLIRFLYVLGEDFSCIFSLFLFVWISVCW